MLGASAAIRRGASGQTGLESWSRWRTTLGSGGSGNGSTSCAADRAAATTPHAMTAARAATMIPTTLPCPVRRSRIS